MPRIFNQFVLLILLLHVTALPSRAELSAAQELQAQEIFGSVMSPYCVARTLRDCPSSAAHDLQRKIRDQIVAGKTREEIMEELISIHGQKIRATPDSKSAFGMLGWLAPAGFALLGLSVLVIWLARRKQGDARPQAAVQPVDAAMEARIKEELSKF